MISCALTKDQITIVYKKVYKELLTKGQEFNPDSFMKELFNQIAERSTPETAANFLQVVPSIIASQLITDFVGKINPSAYVANLYLKLLNILIQITYLKSSQTYMLSQILKDLEKVLKMKSRTKVKKMKMKMVDMTTLQDLLLL